MEEHYADRATYLDSLLLCKDCKWCQYKVEDGRDYSRCTNPEVKTFNGNSPVTGLEEYVLPYAEFTRKHGKCGMEGKLFGLKMYPIRETGKGGKDEPKSVHLTRDNCYEHGFRWDADNQRFV